MRLCCLPVDLAGALWVLAAWALWGHRRGSGRVAGLWVRGGVACCMLAEGSWPARTWWRGWGASTIGHAIMLGPGRQRDARLWRHELAHVRQCEAAQIQACLLALPMALVSDLVPGLGWAALAAWCLGGYPLMVAGGLLQAALSGRRPYRDSPHELAAYALQESPSQDDLTPIEWPR